MSKVVDITGQTFGKLTVIKQVENNKDGRAQWLCQCECGNTKIALGKTLRSGGTKSCGCLVKNNSHRQDLTGKIFGRLTVIKDSGKRTKYQGVIYECKCICGETTFVEAHSLLRGDTKSCGCLSNRDLTGQRFGKLLILEQTKKRNRSGGIYWKCQCDCGRVVNVQSKCLIAGNTRSCGCIKKSVGEALIREILETNKIEYIREYSKPNWIFEDTKFQGRFDFFLPKYNRLIEFDGIQHYEEVDYFTASLEKVQEHDKIKNQWAKESNIDLVRIPYWERDNLSLELIMGDKYIVE